MAKIQNAEPYHVFYHGKDGKTQYHSQKLNQAIKRTAENLVDENRIKKEN
jgi:hypothetical protein